MRKELFFIMLPLKYALKRRLVTKVDALPIPEGSECPRYYRDEHVVGTIFFGWHIVDSETMHRRLVTSLSNEEAMLSPWGMISVPDIADRIESNWTPMEWT